MHTAGHLRTPASLLFPPLVGPAAQNNIKTKAMLTELVVLVYQCQPIYLAYQHHVFHPRVTRNTCVQYAPYVGGKL